MCGKPRMGIEDFLWNHAHAATTGMTREEFAKSIGTSVDNVYQRVHYLQCDGHRISQLPLGRKRMTHKERAAKALREIRKSGLRV